jgi:lysozyme
MTLAQFIESQEGRMKHAYKDATGYSLGVGHFLTKQELTSGFIQLPFGICDWKQGLADNRIDELLQQDIDNVNSSMTPYVHVDLTPGQRKALIDFTFNLGLGHLRISTLLKLINQGVTDERIHTELQKWTLSQGLVIEGLKRRREAEWDIWTGKLVLE